MKPRLHCPKRFGVRPGSPVLYRIAASGDKPMRFHAEPLPAGLRLDEATGQITGKLAEPDEHVITVGAENAHGHCTQALRLVAGKEICLTPPLGWNSWNCWSAEVSQDKVLASARAMVESGLADYGWTYINIDDCWQGLRTGPRHALAPNERFPDMAGLCAEIHHLGLKVGIYSTPWYGSYTGNPGGSAYAPDGSDWTPLPSREWIEMVQRHRHAPYKFDFPDAWQWADWGVDYLKYDWAPVDLDSTHRMRQALGSTSRDIVLSLSNNCPKSLAVDILDYAHAVRTTSDLHDFWETGARHGTSDVHGIRDVWKRHHAWQPYTRPGHYADADMLVVGQVGWGQPRPTRLSRPEQTTHVNLWSLWASPLLVGCPLDGLDAFTRSLLTNADLLDIHQDPLCVQAYPAVVTPEHEVLVKPLEDGGWAVGLFNVSEETRTVEWDATELVGDRSVRVSDVWTANENELRGTHGVTLPAHGSQVLRVFVEG